MEEKNSNTDHFIQMTSTLNSKRKRNILTDFTLTCNGKTFPVHKLVICSFSEHFNDLLQRDSRITTSNMSEIPAAILEILLEYMYTGNLTIPHNVKIGCVLASASLLRLHSVVSQCTQRMLKIISNENILEFLKVAEEYNILDMKHAITRHLVANFKSLIESDILAKTPLEYMKQVISQNVSTCSSDELFQAVLKWSEFDQVSTQTKNANELVKWIDADKLSTDYLLKVSDNPVVLNNKSLMQKLFKVNCKRLKELTLLNSWRPNVSCDLNTVPVVEVTNKSHDSVVNGPLNKGINVTLRHISNAREDKYFERFKIVGVSTNLNRIICYDLENGREETFMDSIDIPFMDINEIKFYYSSVCFHGDQIYFLGGYCNGSPLKSTIALDIRTKQWGKKADMNMGRWRPSYAALDDLVYIVGGCHDDRRSFECYSASCNTWTMLSPMHVDMLLPNVCTVHDSLYITDFTFDLKQIQMQKYNPRLAQWTVIKTINPLPLIPSYSGRVANIDGKMFALHTDQKSAYISEFEPASETWSTIVTLPVTFSASINYFGNFYDNICIVSENRSVMLISPDNMKILKTVQLDSLREMNFIVCAKF